MRTSRRSGAGVSVSPNGAGEMSECPRPSSPENNRHVEFENWTLHDARPLPLQTAWWNKEL
eukprot:scaffold254913_cov35-Tisochrysis_lutea.AAC.1